MKYKLINAETGEEHLCEKIVITGFDYYFKNERICKVGQFYIDDTNTIRQSITDNEFYWSKRLNYKIVIATNNPNIDIPKAEDEVYELAFKFYESIKKEYYSSTGQKAQLPKTDKEFRAMEDGFIAGYKKAQEGHPFSEDDMIEFALWLNSIDDIFEQTKHLDFEKPDDELVKEIFQIWKSQKPQTIYFK